MQRKTLSPTLAAACAYYEENEPRGEYVLVIRGAEEEERTLSPEEALALVRELQEGGSSLKDAVKRVAADHGLSKNELYQWAIGD